jgi:ribosomal protein L11 methyltransferase
MNTHRSDDEPEPDAGRRQETDRWLEASVRVVPEAAEAVAEVLSRYAPEGVAIDAGTGDEPGAVVTVKAYLAFDEEIEARRRKVAEGIWHLSHIWSVIPEPTFRVIEDQDWTRGWKQTIPVLHLGGRLVIKPTWRDHEPGEGEIILEMDPGVAFGTGLHPTTRLCIAIMEEALDVRASQARTSAAPTSILDLGTGTGILAIAAAKLAAAQRAATLTAATLTDATLTDAALTGTGPILALDIDPHAVTAARRNARANGVADQIEIRRGSLADAHGTYDLVLANILTPVIITMAGEGLADRLNPGGILVASGILVEQAGEVAAALQEAGLVITEERAEEAWVALVARHPDDTPPLKARRIATPDRPADRSPSTRSRPG